MAGRIDEFSRSLGAIEATLKSVQRSIDLDRALANERHQENSGALARLDERLDKLEPIANTVETMQPIVAGYQITRWKVTGAVSLALFAAWLIGSLLSVASNKAFGWIMSLIRG